MLSRRSFFTFLAVAPVGAVSANAASGPAPPTFDYTRMADAVARSTSHAYSMAAEAYFKREVSAFFRRLSPETQELVLRDINDSISQERLIP